VTKTELLTTNSVDTVDPEVRVDRAVVGVLRHPRRTDLVEAAAEPLPDQRGAITVAVHQPTDAEVPQIVVPVLVDSQAAVDVGIAEAKIDVEPQHPERVRDVAEPHDAVGGRQVFAVVLERITVRAPLDEKAPRFAPLREHPLEAEAEEEPEQPDRVSQQVAQMGPDRRALGHPVRRARHLRARERKSLRVGREPGTER